MRLLRFVNEDEDQRRFQYLYGALLVAGPHQDDIRIMLVRESLRRKLESISDPDPYSPPVGIERMRRLNDPRELVLEDDEVKLLIGFLGVVKWKGASSDYALDAIGWLLRTEGPPPGYGLGRGAAARGGSGVGSLS